MNSHSGFLRMHNFFFFFSYIIILYIAMVGILWRTRDLCAPLENRFYAFYRGLCVRKGLIIMEGWLYIYFFFSVSCSNAIAALLHPFLHQSLSIYLSRAHQRQTAEVELYRILRKPFGGNSRYTYKYIPPARLTVFCKGGIIRREIIYVRFGNVAIILFPVGFFRSPISISNWRTYRTKFGIFI